MAIDRILERLDSLIDMGSTVLRAPTGEMGYYRDTGLFRQWRTSSVAFLNTLPSNYVYHHEFETHCKNAYHPDAQEGIAILRAAKEDIEGGYLQKVESLVSAEVFSDFLDMAEHLLDNNYKDPAASLTGAVLEDGLRRVCLSNNIDVEHKDSISSLNQKLVKEKVYNPLQQKQIQVWNDIRNNADHGHFDEYKSDNVKDMVTGVVKFLADYLK